jgi:hypothetical protein
LFDEVEVEDMLATHVLLDDEDEQVELGIVLDIH